MWVSLCTAWRTLRTPHRPPVCVWYTCAHPTDPQKAKLKAAEDTFKSSDTLKALLQKSEANKAKNKREIANKYCYR